jgi:hypothetical protein
MAPANLILNCFSADISPTSIELPFVDYRTHLEASTSMRREYSGYLVQRHTLENNTIRLILLNGPQEPSTLDKKAFDVGETPEIGTKLINRSLSDYMYSKGMRTSHDKSTTRATMKVPSFSRGLIDLYDGIEFQVRRPFEGHPYRFVVSVQWKVTVMFRESLDNETLKEICIGMPVIYKPEQPASMLPADLLRFRYRYLGHVERVESDGNALVFCKDATVRNVPLSTLFLEGAPTVLREYETKAGLMTGPQSIWQKIQEHEFILNRTGRRNSSILKDRMHAIRRSLGGNSKEHLVLPLSCFRDGSVDFELTPLQVEMR